MVSLEDQVFETAPPKDDLRRQKENKRSVSRFECCGNFPPLATPNLPISEIGVKELISPVAFLDTAAERAREERVNNKKTGRQKILTFLLKAGGWSVVVIFHSKDRVLKKREGEREKRMDETKTDNRAMDTQDTSFLETDAEFLSESKSM